MNRYFLIMKMLQQNDSNTGRNAAVMIIVLLLLFPLFIIILIATALSMPADWIKDHLLLEALRQRSCISYSRYVRILYSRIRLYSKVMISVCL